MLYFCIESVHKGDMNMNFGQMIVGLGYKEKPAHKGLAAPVIIRSESTHMVGWGHLETADQIDSYVESHTSLAKRVSPKRGFGDWT